MSCAFLRVSAIVSVFLLISGCGGTSGGGAGNGGGGSNPPPPPQTTVTFTITGPAPTAVATQIGSGPFTAATITSAGVLTLTVPSGTANFAVAFVCPPSSLVYPAAIETGAAEQTDEWVYEASTEDGNALTGSCPMGPQTPAGATGTMTGTIDASAAGATFVDVVASNSSFTAETMSPSPLYVPTFSINFAAPAGSDRVEAVAYFQYFDLPCGNCDAPSVVSVKNLNNQAVPGALNGGNPVVFSAGDKVVNEPLSFTNVPEGWGASTDVTYKTGSVGGFDLGTFGPLIQTAPTNAYSAVPAAAIQPGDNYQFYASASGGGPLPAAYMSVGTNQMVAAATGAVSISFPAAWGYTGPTPAALPVFDVSYSGFLGKPAAFNEVGFAWMTPQAGGPTSMGFCLEVAASGNYLNGTTTVAVPDLSGVGGFVPPPASGELINWSAELANVWDQAFVTTGFKDTASSENMNSVINSGVYTVP